MKDEVKTSRDMDHSLFMEKLEVFYNKYGHCNVTITNEDKWLWTKVVNIRTAFKNNRLSEEIIDRLNSKGFNWTGQNSDIQWNLFLDKLKKFKDEFGHCNVPQSYNDKWLANKCVSARLAYFGKKGKIENWVVEELNKINFIWKPSTANTGVKRKKSFDYTLFLEKINTYHKSHGHCNVPKNYDDKWLYKVCSQIRRKHKDGKLEEYVVNELNKLEFHFDRVKKNQKINDDSIELFIQYLLAFKLKHGHCLVPYRYESGDFRLGYWVNRLRTMYKNGKLPQSVIENLNKVKFEWKGYRLPYAINKDDF
jgi:Helicase associated domain.